MKERLSEGGEKALERFGVNQEQSLEEQPSMKADLSQTSWKRKQVQRLVGKQWEECEFSWLYKKAGWNSEAKIMPQTCMNCIFCLSHPWKVHLVWIFRTLTPFLTVTSSKSGGPVIYFTGCWQRPSTQAVLIGLAWTEQDVVRGMIWVTQIILFLNHDSRVIRMNTGKCTWNPFPRSSKLFKISPILNCILKRMKIC